LNRYRQVSGVTLKDGEAIHLNHEQTINYDRGSLNDADGKLVVSSPKRVSLDDNPFFGESRVFTQKGGNPGNSYYSRNRTPGSSQTP